MLEKRNVIYLNIIFILIVLLIICIYLIFSKTKNIVDKGEYGNLREIEFEYNSKEEYFSYYETILQNYEKSKFDSNGILMTEYDEEYVYDIKSISYYGLMLFSKYISENEINYYEMAKKQANYLVSIQNNDNGGFYNNYNFTVEGTTYEMDVPWISSTSQSMAISLLSRIYSISNEQKYKDACELANICFKNEVQNGGLHTKIFEHDFFEEYPTDLSNYSLSGLMYTIIGMYDEYQVFGNIEAKEIYELGITTLEYIIPLYDSNGVSLQNLAFINNEELKKSYKEKYNREHIYQLITINQISSKEIFNYYIDKWSKLYNKNV